MLGPRLPDSRKTLELKLSEGHLLEGIIIRQLSFHAETVKNFLRELGTECDHVLVCSWSLKERKLSTLTLREAVEVC